MKNHGMIWTWISIQLNATLVKSQLSRSKLYASFKHASCSYAWKTVNTVQSSGGGRAVSMHGAHHAKNRHLRGPATDYFYQLIFMTWLRGRKYIWSYYMNEIILKKKSYHTVISFHRLKIKTFDCIKMQLAILLNVTYISSYLKWTINSAAKILHMKFRS